MKKLLFIAAAVISLTAAAQKPDDVIKVSEAYNFGKIKQGEPVTTFFTITNTSGQPVVIESVTAGCGCTTPEWDKAPIAAKKTAQIKVGFNAGAMGPFTKPVYIKLAGVADTKVINITGEVVDEAAYNNYVQSDEYKKWKDTQKKGNGTKGGPKPKK
jgi:hypothetical protein